MENNSYIQICGELYISRYNLRLNNLERDDFRIKKAHSCSSQNRRTGKHMNNENILVNNIIEYVWNAIRIRNSGSEFISAIE